MTDYNHTKHGGHYWRNDKGGFTDPFHAPYASRKTLRTLPEPKPPPKRDKDRAPQAQEIRKQQEDIAANRIRYTQFVSNQNKYLRILNTKENNS